MNKKMLLSVIIPCYNEEEVLEETWESLSAVLDNLENMEYEMLFVNDGSRDQTGEILRTLALKDDRVRVISLSRNFGHQPALTAGLNHCRGDLAVILDADLQDPPELIPEMIKVYRETESNCIYAVRKSRAQEAWFKKISAKLFYKLINFLSDTAIPANTGDFRLIDRKIIDAFNTLGESNKFIRGLISWLGFKQIPLYYHRQGRKAGKPKYTLRKLIRLALSGVFYFSKKPLLISFTIGLFCLLLAGLLFLFVIYGYFFTDRDVPGWASLAIIVVFFSGVNLLGLGLVAQYIANIFDEVKRRPQYIISEKINIQDVP